MANISAIPEDQWLACQREFIECRMELKPLAGKYGVKYNTLRYRARSEGWGRARAEYRRKLIEAPPAQVAQVLAMQERPIVINGHSQEYFQQANVAYVGEVMMALGMVKRAREQFDGAIDVTEALGWTTIYDRLLDRVRILMGIPLPAPIRQREKQSKGSTVIPVELSPPELEKS